MIPVQTSCLAGWYRSMQSPELYKIISFLSQQPAKHLPELQKLANRELPCQFKTDFLCPAVEVYDAFSKYGVTI